jgi:hypothetical protein
MGRGMDHNACQDPEKAPVGPSLFSAYLIEVPSALPHCTLRLRPHGHPEASGLVGFGGDDDTSSFLSEYALLVVIVLTFTLAPLVFSNETGLLRTSG